MQLCLGVYAVLFKHGNVLRSLEVRNSVGGCPEIEKASFFSLPAPLIGVSVAVEDYIRIFLDSLFDKVVQSILEVVRFFKHIGKLVEGFGNDGVYHRVGSCDGEP